VTQRISKKRTFSWRFLSLHILLTKKKHIISSVDHHYYSVRINIVLYLKDINVVVSINKKNIFLFLLEKLFKKLIDVLLKLIK
jgi:hypothetical protein